MTTKILIISDGRPGHFRQSEAVAMAVAKLGDTKIEWLKVEPRLKRLARIFRSLANGKGLAPQKLVKIAYKKFNLPSEQTDLIISAGGATLTANMALAKLYGVPNIFCGSHRNARPENFAAVLIPYSHMAGAKNHIVLPKPSPVDPDAMRKANTMTNEVRPKKLIGALLIGGPTDEHPFTSAEWDEVLKIVQVGSATGLVDWVVTTSPRTPDAIADRLAEISQHANSVQEFIDFRTSESGSILSLLARSDFAVCTEDSSSMVIEAICAQRPTISLQPSINKMSGKENKMLNEMADKNYLARLSIEANLKDRIGPALRALRPMAENHLDPLARAIEPLLRKQ